MAARPNATQLTTRDAVPQSVSEKVRSLVTKIKYETPKVVSFPVNELNVSVAMSLAGNL